MNVSLILILKQITKYLFALLLDNVTYFLDVNPKLGFRFLDSYHEFYLVSLIFYI